MGIRHALAVVAFLLALPAAAQMPPGRDCTVCPEMVFIPAGTFRAGMDESESLWGAMNDWEKGVLTPAVMVTIRKPFLLGRYEVTRAEYEAFVKETGHVNELPCRKALPTQAEMTPGATWQNPGYAVTDRHPVVCVTHKDAQAYAAWLSRKTGLRYRLPSENEWEYAASAGRPGYRFWGNGLAEACRYANGADLTRAKAANVAPNSALMLCEDGSVDAARVGSYYSNPWGLYDMLGNVWEWVEGCSSTGANRSRDEQPVSTAQCEGRVLRGGSFWGWQRIISVRYKWNPTNGNIAQYDIGFRVARDQ